MVLKCAGGMEALVTRGKKGAIFDRLRARFKDHEFISVPSHGGKPADVGEAAKRLSERTLGLRPKKDGVDSHWVWQRTVGDLDVVLLHPGALMDDAKGMAQIRASEKLWRTLRDGTEPGPQLDLARERAFGRFPRKDGPPLGFTLPRGWKLSKPSSKMRLAQFEIPGTPPLSGAVFWFGAGKGGTVAMNMQRWAGQMQVESDTSVKPKTIEVAKGIRATVLDLTGTYVAAVRPGAAERVNRPKQRLLATALEVPDGPLFVKLVGEKAAVDKVADAYLDWIGSFRVKK